ncbi:MAG: tripartite tricarboxylate transporter permease [Bacillota bacterium]
MWVAGFLAALSGGNILWLFLGTFFGLIIGVLPALGANFGVALMLPFTFGLDTAAALIFLCAIHAACNYGDSIASILLNVPGGPGTVATCWDGYPMAQQGMGGRALGIATLSSFIGGTIAWLSLAGLAIPIGNLAMKIGGPEYFVLGLMALSLVSVASKGETIKGLIMACLGLLLSTIGQDPVTGLTYRFSFGIPWLEAGIPIVVSTLGIFAIAQIITLLEEGKIIAKTIDVHDSIFSGFWEVIRRPLTVLRAGIVGWFVGILPALGVALAGVTSYLVEKNYSPERERFGKGAPGGVVAAEVGKGACVIGDLIPTFTLGIPGSVTGAILMGALIIHGVDPGPRFLLSGKLPYIVFAGLLLGQFAYLIFGPFVCKILAKVIFLPTALLAPVITVLAFLGAFTERNYTFDILIMVAFGIVAYAFGKIGYPVVCMVLGLILGPIIETNFSRSLGIDYGSYAIFLQRPIALTLLIITLLFLTWPYFKDRLGIFKKVNIIDNEARATQETKVNNGEILTLIFIGVINIIFTYEAVRYQENVRLFPMVIIIASLVLIVPRLLILIKLALKHKYLKKDFIRSPKEKEQCCVLPWPISMILFLAYAAMVYLTGFAIASTIFVIATAFCAGYRKWLILLSIGVGVGIFTLVFGNILHILLPQGVILKAILY